MWTFTHQHGNCGSTTGTLTCTEASYDPANPNAAWSASVSTTCPGGSISVTGITADAQGCSPPYYAIIFNPGDCATCCEVCCCYEVICDSSINPDCEGGSGPSDGWIWEPHDATLDCEAYVYGLVDCPSVPPAGGSYDYLLVPDEYGSHYCFGANGIIP